MRSMMSYIQCSESQKLRYAGKRKEGRMREGVREGMGDRGREGGREGGRGGYLHVSIDGGNGAIDGKGLQAQAKRKLEEEDDAGHGE
jgi:hypothetical protein